MKEGQHSLNQRIEKFIAEKDFRKESFSKEDIDFIQQYEGSGGQANQGATGEGILYEYFTPDYIVDLMWELARIHGFNGGNILEPSIGTGRIIRPAKDFSKCVGFEINPLSARIAKITFPEATIYPGYFETAFLEAPRFTSKIKQGVTWLREYPFSLVIGNPPYGKYQNTYSSYFTNPSFPQIEIFFIYQGLKLLKKDGLMVYLISSNFLKNGDTYNNSKKELMKVCDLVDAYRLPPVFKNSDVPVDIIVLKKK
jgi:type I restriction-modification system DNA methylase subunit